MSMSLTKIVVLGIFVACCGGCGCWSSEEIDKNEPLVDVVVFGPRESGVFSDYIVTISQRGKELASVKSKERVVVKRVHKNSELTITTGNGWVKPTCKCRVTEPFILVSVTGLGGNEIHANAMDDVDELIRLRDEKEKKNHREEREGAGSVVVPRRLSSDRPPVLR